jgi:hypothetical protein
MQEDDRAIYRICLQGKLGDDWLDWFEGMEMVADRDPTGKPVTTLTGPVADQPALQGTLARLATLNLTLVSVNKMSDRA